MESDYKEKFDEMATSVQEIKTANKFALQRLNQLVNCTGGKCPVCGCDCATDGYSDVMHELELKVEDLEKKRTEMESQISIFLGQFKRFQKRIQSVIRDLPETLQEILGTLFNMMEPFQRQIDGAQDEIDDITESSISAEYAQESSINAVVSERKGDKEESLLEEEKSDSINLSQNSQVQHIDCPSACKSEYHNQNLMDIVVNTVQEHKHSVLTSVSETEETDTCTNRESLKYKEVSTQTLDFVVQSPESSYKTTAENQADDQSKASSPSPALQELSPSSRSKATPSTDKPKCSASKLPEVVVQREKTEVQEAMWHILGTEEDKKAKALGLPDASGAHTTLCFDISGSMAENDAWTHAQIFFDAFIGGLEEIQAEHEGVVEENIALCTFGHHSGIIQRLTKDFQDVRKAFKSIKLGGPSPMFGGLLLSVAALARPEDKLCTVHDVPVMPRIIMVTDGHCTHTDLIAGPDELGDSTQQDQTKSKLIELSQKFVGGINLTCVPAGHADQEYLELLAAAGNGKVVSYKDGRKLAEETLQMLKIGTAISADSISGLKGAIGGLLSGGLLSGDGSLEDMLSGKIPSDLLRRLETDRDDYYLERDNENLPKIGSRVRRGPDWHWKQQDSYGPGTVIGHAAERMSAWVEWDANAHINIYRYGGEGAFDLLLIDEPRILSKTETIAVGCIVKKGPGWKSYIGEDGPAERGVVIKRKPDNTVMVYWDDKKRGTYKWDGSRNGEIVVCDPKEKAFQGDGHVLGGGPEFEARQRQKEQAQTEAQQQQQQRKTVKKKNKNIVS